MKRIVICLAALWAPLLFAQVQIQGPTVVIGGSGGTPAGSSSQLQINNAGVFGASSCAVDLLTTSNLTCPGTITAQSAVLSGYAITKEKINLQAAPYNASGFIAQTVASANTASGTLIIPVASSSGFSAGQIVIVANGGTSNQKDFAAFIASVGAGTITLSATPVTGNLLPPTAVSGATGISGAITSGWLVYTVGTTTLSAIAASGASSVALTNAASYTVGEGLEIFGGAAGGANLFTTITAVSGNSLTISPAIGNASGVAAGVAVRHDDSAALQAAVNTTTVGHSTKIYLPDGFYQVNQSVSIPCVIYYPGLTAWYPEASLEIDGGEVAPQTQSYLATITQPSVAGVVIRSDLNSPSTPILGTATCSASQLGFTNVNLVVRNITWRSIPNPQGSAINAGKVASFQLYGFNLDTGDTGQTTQPTDHSNQNVGVTFPSGENAGGNVASTGLIMGWYWGMNTAEHTRLEHVIFSNDYFPWEIGGASSDYGVSGVDIIFVGCPHGIAVSANIATKLDIRTLNIEHSTSPAWVTSIDDITDSVGYLSGFISMDNNPGFGALHYTGAVNVVITSANAPSYPLPTQVYADLSNSHYLTSPNGMMVWLSDGMADAVCSGGSTGAWAYRLNGAWTCEVPGGALSSKTNVNFSTFTKVDSAGILSVGGQNVAATGITLASSSYLYKDYGVGAFDTLASLQGQFTVNTPTNGAVDACIILDLSTAIGSPTTTGNNVGLQVNSINSTQADLYYIEYNGGTNVHANKINATLHLTSGTTYYYTLSRATNSFTSNIYTDAAHSNLIWSLTEPLTTVSNYQYLYGIAGNAQTGTATMTVTNGSINILAM